MVRNDASGAGDRAESFLKHISEYQEHGQFLKAQVLRRSESADGARLKRGPRNDFCAGT